MIADLLEFLEEWELKNVFLDSSDLDKAQKFMKELGAEIDKISVDPPVEKKQLIFYGGWDGEVPLWRIAQGAFDSGGDMYFISDTIK